MISNRLTSIAALTLLSTMGAMVTPTALAKDSAPITAEVAVANEAAQALIARVIPEHADSFVVDTTLPKDDGNDTFEISDTDQGKILLAGNNGVSVASALHWYLTERGGCSVTWDSEQLELPAQLPKVGKKVKVTTPHKKRVYFNYCTLNYTASWWKWDRWERETDIMAMKGINMPLGVVGLEGVWYHTLLKQGYTDLEARTFLVAPSHFAWQWMTNIQGEGDPLPKEWIDQRIALSKKLFDRQRALGMTPIQQGFTGYVPRSLKKKFPDASIAQEHRWCGYPGTSQLDPLDPLFKKIGKTFLETQIELYGTNHIYAADPFHEGHPPRPGNEYLAKVGTEIFNLLTSVDPKATVAMQSWSIRQPICEAFPKDRLFVLDLAGRRTDFWGYRYVKGQLHNFGGRINMHGDLRYVGKNPFAADAKKDPLCVGMGLFPESIEQNPVFYNMVFDMIWRDSPVDTEKWLSSYAARRYGKSTPNTQAAWKLLLNGPYTIGTNGTENSSIICARPALVAKKSGPNSGFEIPYDPKSLVQAWELMLKDYDQLKDNPGYRYDLADITRQVLTNLGQELHRDVEFAFKSADADELKKSTDQFLELLLDVDTQLAPLPTHHFGKWVRDARSHSEDPATQAYYEKYASMLVSIWGPEKQPLIFDYSWREWSGLIKEYYHPRWKTFFDHLQAKLAAGEDYTDPTQYTHGREALRANSFYSKLADWEIAWVGKKREATPVSKENAATISKRLFEKYQPILTEIYSDARKQKIQELLKQREAQRAEAMERIHGKLIYQWKPELIKPEWTTVEIDVSKALDDAGTYEVAFLYDSGAHALEVEVVELMLNGNVIDSDKHPGSTGHKNKNNRYTVTLEDFAFNSKYQLRVKLRGSNGNHSFGKVRLKKLR